MDYLTGIQKAFTGVTTTLEITVFAVILGVALGLLVALMKMSKLKVLRAIGSVYVEILRGTPLLVQALIWYNGVPALIQGFGIDFTWRGTGVLVGIIACGINSSAYVAEIIRAGLQAVDQGQTEAARSLGLSAKNTMIKIILPQAIKNILPSLANEYISMIKQTSMAGTFKLYELMYTRTLLANKYLAWQPLFIIAGIYLVMTLVLTNLVKLFERRMSVSD